MSILRYDPAIINQAVADLDAFCNTLESRLDELAGRLANIRDTWESQQAREAFDQKQAQWDAAVDRIRSAVSELARALTQASENMIGVDKNASGYF